MRHLDSWHRHIWTLGRDHVCRNCKARPYIIATSFLQKKIAWHICLSFSVIGTPATRTRPASTALKRDVRGTYSATVRWHGWVSTSLT